MQIVEKHAPRQFTAMAHDGGIVLCTDQGGAFLCLRFTEEYERLVTLLGNINTERLPTGGTGE